MKTEAYELDFYAWWIAFHVYNVGPNGAFFSKFCPRAYMLNSCPLDLILFKWKPSLTNSISMHDKQPSMCLMWVPAMHFSPILFISLTQPLTHTTLSFNKIHQLTTLSICHSHLLQYNTLSLNNITSCILMHNNLCYTIGWHLINFLSLKHHTINNNSKHILTFSSPHQFRSCNNWLTIDRDPEKNLHIL